MWTIEYDNDTGDEGFCQRWTVTDGERSFRCDTQKDAEWLRDILNLKKIERD
jgi:hypothetical protein